MAALRTLTASYPYMALIIRADVEIGRGHFDAARAHLDAARATLREDRGLGLYDGYLAELALWERRWADAAQAIDDGLTQAQSDEAAQIRVQLCAKGLRAQAELAALARARRDDAALRAHLDRARELLAVARRAAADAAPITPNAAGWHLLARAEHDRARGAARPQAWADAAAAWDRLERPPLAAYCRWRQAEALRRRGRVPRRGERAAPRTRTPSRPGSAPGPWPPSSSCSPSAPGSTSPRRTPARAAHPARSAPWKRLLGLTPREADVLALIARGYTNREIATHARHQRQDRRRPRLAHPAQARRPQPPAKPPPSPTASPRAPSPSVAGGPAARRRSPRWRGAGRARPGRCRRRR